MTSFAELFARLGSDIGPLMFVGSIISHYLPHELGSYVNTYFQRLVLFATPCIQISFNELAGDRLNRNEAYSAVENYLSIKYSKEAKRLKADIKNNSLVLSMDEYEVAADEYEGAKVWWVCGKNFSKSTDTNSSYYKLFFHKRHRDLITRRYLNHVLKEEPNLGNPRRKLYTNTGSHWNHVVLQNPATFQTLAMDPDMKKEIMLDLDVFSTAGGFYARTGRAWKRGYLLSGPPGTGKSTLVAAMANHLGYDTYDLDLTAVEDNIELRKLLIEMSSKSIIVIEDIDRALDSGQMRMRKASGEAEERGKLGMQETETKPYQVTLSGILNFIDGLGSACCRERLIVFTTNHLEKLDAALIRKGRMDKHIELSYCQFEAFKVLAKNYLEIDAHELFPTICSLLMHANMTPADVAEHLTPKTISGDDETFQENADICLKNLIKALDLIKEEEDARLKYEDGESDRNYLQPKRKKLMVAPQDHLIIEKRARY